MDFPLGLTLDSNRNVVCPECGTAVKCGAAGPANFEKWRRGTFTCRAANLKEKRGKEMKKKKKDRSILSFLKPRPTAAPSTVIQHPTRPLIGNLLEFKIQGSPIYPGL
jgi:hypothetical protein